MREKSTVERLARLPFSLLGWLCLLSVSGKAQNSNFDQLAAGKSLGELQAWLAAPLPAPNTIAGWPFQLPVNRPEGKNLGPAVCSSLQPFALDIQPSQAFFCRLEHQLALKIQVPFKFRLGSVQYVDWLEGKPASGY